jgi:hypothetical protein
VLAASHHRSLDTYPKEKAQVAGVFKTVLVQPIDDADKANRA